MSVSTEIRQTQQQLWFNHRCKDLGLVPAGLRIKSPLNTREAIRLVASTRRRLIKARINDNHRRLKHYKRRVQHLHSKLSELLPTYLLDTVRDIADKRAQKTATEHRTKLSDKLNRLRTKQNKKRRNDDNWV